VVLLLQLSKKLLRISTVFDQNRMIIYKALFGMIPA